MQISKKIFFLLQGIIYALCALKKNIKKQEKQEKTMMVLFCFLGFILFLSGRLRILYPLDLLAFLLWQASLWAERQATRGRAGTMTECSQPQRGMTMVASHFNGWVKDVNGKRAFRYATISGGVSRTYGTPAYAKYAIPAILGRAKRQSRGEMVGYPYQMPTA